MISSRAVSIILLIVFGIFYKKNKGIIVSLKIYFVLLGVMALAGVLFDPLPLMGLYPTEYYPKYILFFAILMLVVIKPWFVFDKFLINKPIFSVKEKYIKTIKKIYVVVIVLSFYAIIYTLPYTMIAWAKGADAMKSGSGILPHSIFTTLAVGFATFSPVTIVLFYISLLDKRLSKFGIFLLVSSLAYIVTSMAQGARDGFIYTSLTYYVFYVIFKPSYNIHTTKQINKLIIVLFFLMMIPLSIYSLSRFGKEQSEDNMLYGTWGYIYQQPYVFDHILDQFDTFYGFNRRLKFLNNIIPIEGCEYAASSKIEYMFGTQFASYYMISGYSSLLIATIIYIFTFEYLIKKSLKRNLIFPSLVVFVIYIYFTLSGLFYFRFGGNDSEFLFYMAILFGSLKMPDLLYVSYSNIYEK